MVANSHPTHVGKYRHFQLEIHGFNNNNKSLEIRQDAPDRLQPPILDQKKPTVAHLNSDDASPVPDAVPARGTPPAPPEGRLEERDMGVNA